MPGSWIGTSRRLSDRILAASMSIAITSCPISAKHVAVTRPTQPTPITPIGRSPLIGGSIVACSRWRRGQPVYFCIDSAMANI